MGLRAWLKRRRRSDMDTDEGWLLTFETAPRWDAEEWETIERPNPYEGEYELLLAWQANRVMPLRNIRLVRLDQRRDRKGELAPGLSAGVRSVVLDTMELRQEKRE